MNRCTCGRIVSELNEFCSDDCALEAALEQVESEETERREWRCDHALPVRVAERW